MVLSFDALDNTLSGGCASCVRVAAFARNRTLNRLPETKAKRAIKSTIKSRIKKKSLLDGSRADVTLLEVCQLKPLQRHRRRSLSAGRISWKRCRRRFCRTTAADW